MNEDEECYGCAQRRHNLRLMRVKMMKLEDEVVDLNLRLAQVHTRYKYELSRLRAAALAADGALDTSK